MPTSKKTLAAIIGTAASLLVVPFIKSNEGTANVPYKDSGGVWTVCTGQTGVPMRYYTDQQCDTMLANTLANTAQQVVNVTPGYAALPDGVKAATLDFAYNVGVTAYASSTYKRRIVAGDLPGACDELLKWRFVKNKDCSLENSNCRGIWTRRQAERDMCNGTVH